MEQYIKEAQEARKTLSIKLKALEAKKDEAYGKHLKDTNWKGGFDSQWYYGTIDPLNKEIAQCENDLYAAKSMALQAGDRISLSPYSDWQSYTVVSRTHYTLTCVEDRQTKFKDSWQDGELECEQDPNGPRITLHWSKKHGMWSYGCYRVALGVRNYRDPCF